MSKDKTLIIVESPAKANKIQKYVGPKYLVMASFGHLLDLPSNSLGVDPSPKKDYALTIVPIKGKQKRIDELKKAYKTCGKQLILAPDPDREGEAIGYYCAKMLGADPFTTPRISFSEITKTAILQALKSPGLISETSVKAQMARRALDRILGYKISPHVRKITRIGTSAGRCQSPSLLLLKQKEDDIMKSLKTSKQRIRSRMVGTIESNDTKWDTECDPIPDFPKTNWMNVNWNVYSVKKGNPVKSHPPPPFITSTLLITAINRLGYTTGYTKKLMQQMYEKGWITYIRTDSTVISGEAQQQVKEYLKHELNVKSVPRSYNKKKGEHAQEAHECIRPTLIKRIPADLDNPFKRLYELIWNRTLSSQMEASQSISVSIQVGKRDDLKKQSPLLWSGTKSYCIKSGWKQIDGVEEIHQKDIPVPKKNSTWIPESIIVEEIVPNPPRRYTDATFVSQLEKQGIGRPSTYATIIETIQSRGYANIKDIQGDNVDCRIQIHTKKTMKDTVEKKPVGKETRRLCLTPLGKQVCDVLYPSSETLLGIKATSHMESLLDDICMGKNTYQNVIGSYWKQLETVLETIQTQNTVTEHKNHLGTQIINGETFDIGFEVTRYGPAVTRVLHNSTDKKSKEYGNVPKGMTIDDVTLEQAIQLLPLSLGTWKRSKVIAKKGKYGPYLMVGKDKYVSIPSDMDWSKLTKQTVKAILDNDQKEQLHASSLSSKLNMIVLKGPKGWYMKKTPKSRGISIGDTILDKKIEDLQMLIIPKSKKKA